MSTRYTIGQTVRLPDGRTALVEDVYDQTHTGQRVRVLIDNRATWFEARQLEPAQQR